MTFETIKSVANKYSCVAKVTPEGFEITKKGHTLATIKNGNVDKVCAGNIANLLEALRQIL